MIVLSKCSGGCGILSNTPVLLPPPFPHASAWQVHPAPPANLMRVPQGCTERGLWGWWDGVFCPVDLVRRKLWQATE